MQKVAKSVQNQTKSAIDEIKHTTNEKLHQHNHQHEQTIKALIIGALIGFVFGFALEKSKVFTPSLIRSQMHFTSFTMVKMFLAATASGSLFMSVIEYLGHFQRPSKSLSLGIPILTKYSGNALGGFILGIGMYISGACPGTVAVQFGTTQLWNAKYTLSGALIGAVLFGYFVTWVKTFNSKFLERCDTYLIDKALGIPMWKISLGFSVIVSVIAMITEYFYPWKQDVSPSFVGTGYDLKFPYDPFAPAWHPIAAGILIGSLQIPSWYLLQHHIGTSSAYVTIASYIAAFFDKKMMEHAPYFSNFYSNSDYAQVGTVLGMLVAAFVSTTLSGVQLSVPSTAQGPFTYFLGGFLLLFGARMAGGCPSGHGISGMARLNFASVVSVVAMFAGAILTGLVLQL